MRDRFSSASATWSLCLRGAGDRRLTTNGLSAFRFHFAMLHDRLRLKTNTKICEIKRMDHISFNS